MQLVVLMLQYNRAEITEPQNTMQAVAIVALKEVAESKAGSLAACHD